MCHATTTLLNRRDSRAVRLNTLFQLGDGIDDDRLEKYLLAFYAAQNWTGHA